MQVRFALGSRRLFTLEDALGMSSRKFYELTTEFFDKSAKDIEMQELLAWWDEQIFPATENLLICPQSRRTNKGKGKASIVPTPIASDDEDVDMASDASMDFKEIDESDDSGSEFAISEEEDEAAFVASDSDKEALILSAAAEMLLQNQTPLPSGASGSSQRAPTNKGAALAAAAAERCMGRANKDINDNDYMSDNEDKAELGDSGSDSDTDCPKKHMTLAQLRAEKKEHRWKTNKWKKEIKVKEKKLMRELGLRFTYAEKLLLALLRHHPELKDVWGDLEESIPIIKPTMAEQPDNLKLTLLPFQCESLFWMRKQE
ncbi:hypothetical protein DXG01_003427 [Tephrocybe rancida]|nr:hypothetical protein DXG01_003427 [Tephrocybe rancida]